MTERDRNPAIPLPGTIQETLTDFEEAFGVAVRVTRLDPDAPSGSSDDAVYVGPGFDTTTNGVRPPRSQEVIHPREGPPLALEVSGNGAADPQAVVRVLAKTLGRELESAREVRFFTYELSERYEEINLLYSISETLGSILDLDEAARVILGEVCDVMGALRGSLWVHNGGDDKLYLRAEVGRDSQPDSVPDPDADAVTAAVFQEGRPVIASRVPDRSSSSPAQAKGEGDPPRVTEGESFLSVPIRYSPPSGESRTVGVINLIGRHGGDRFSAADQKLLSAIASQVGAALENNRLLSESLSQERMSREMELAHDLQMKLLPSAERFPAAEAAARVSPAEQVGGDFFQLFKLTRGRVGVMLGDVSLHGFPSALIMTLTMSAAGIYAREHESPARVLREMDDALRDELETTEMFLTLFYGVLDPAAGTLTYANAGHPHAFVVHEDGEMDRLLATDPPMGFAGPDSYSEVQVRWIAEKDLLLLFTDGLSDILSQGTRNDGEDRVLSTVRAHRSGPVTRIVEELFTLTAASNAPILGDDRTALVVRL